MKTIGVTNDHYDQFWRADNCAPYRVSILQLAIISVGSQCINETKPHRVLQLISMIDVPMIIVTAKARPHEGQCDGKREAKMDQHPCAIFDWFSIQIRAKK
jgi:hypothetical protein